MLPLTFSNPEYLGLMLLIPLIVYFGRRSLAGLDPTRRSLALTVRSLIVFVVVLALAEIHWQSDSDELRVIFLLDRSRSIPTKFNEEALSLPNFARKQMQKNDKATLMVFGQKAVVEQDLTKNDPEISRIRSVFNQDQTDISQALEQAINHFPKDSKKRIVLISDGNETLGDAEKWSQIAKKEGIVIDVVPIEYQFDQEVFVEKVVMPSEVKVGEPYVVRVVSTSMTETDAVLELYEDETLVESRDIKLKRGTSVQSFVRVLRKTGFFNVRALLRTKQKSDHLYNNNQAFGFVYVKGQSKILYIHGSENPGGVQSFKEAMSLERINYDSLTASRMPSDESKLKLYDALILDNVPKVELSLKQQQSIEKAVRMLGLGLVMIGGPNSFGAGEWEDEPASRTPVEKALPVLMKPKQKTILTNGALGIIMHSCEFAQGNAWGRKVTIKAISALSAKDSVGVVYYENMIGGPKWCFPLQKALNKPLLKRQVRKMEPGDMPDFDSAMTMCIQGLVKCPATTKHMIILSDGDPSPPRPGLIKTCQQNKLTISTIAIQPHGGLRDPAVRTMKRIARATGGKFYYVRNANQLPRIFIKETKKVARPLLRNVTFQPQIAAASPILKGFKQFPELFGHVLVSPKKRATLALVTPEKEAKPILAHWRYGVGKAVAFTSDNNSRWGRDWLEWGGYANFWGQLIRWVGKEVKDAEFQVRTKIIGDQARIVIDAINEEGEFIDQLNFTGTVLSPDNKELKPKVRQVRAGRYEAEFPVKAVGNYTISLISENAQGEKRAATTGLVFPYSEEYKNVQSHLGRLKQIAKNSGGRVVSMKQALTPKADFFNHDLASNAALLPKWELMFKILLLLFMLDVFVRRVMLDYGKLFSWFSRKGQTEASDPAEKGAAATLSALRQRQEQMRGTTLKKFEALADPSEARIARAELRSSAVATRQAPRSPQQSQPSAASTSPKASSQQNDAMSRLLRAKKRAQKDFEKPE